MFEHAWYKVHEVDSIPNLETTAIGRTIRTRSGHPVFLAYAVNQVSSTYVM
ncbi:hypothetical protein ABEW19_01100 [Paenibacillus illinoisensis]|uniref:hypothetical protein n=1 Tax=Paenibacillus illinoisensis TaxID=59845 RepID=UPI003D2BBF32